MEQDAVKHLKSNGGTGAEKHQKSTNIADASSQELSSTTSDSADQRTGSTGISCQSSNASTLGEERVETSQPGASIPFKGVPEPLGLLIWDWRDQISQSNCSEPIKARDLKSVTSLEVSYFLLTYCGEQSVLLASQQACDHLGPIREACGTEKGASDHTLLKYSMKNGILHRKIKQKDSMKLVICLPDLVLPAFIHHLHKVNNHPSLSASRRKFEHFYYNRNADRMIKSYIKACTLCTKKAEEQVLKSI